MDRNVDNSSAGGDVKNRAPPIPPLEPRTTSGVEGTVPSLIRAPAGSFAPARAQTARDSSGTKLPATAALGPRAGDSLLGGGHRMSTPPLPALSGRAQRTERELERGYMSAPVSPGRRGPLSLGASGEAEKSA